MKDLSRPLLATLAVLAIMTAGLAMVIPADNSSALISDGWEYEITGSYPTGTVSIRNYRGSSESATIPDKISNLNVTEIENSALSSPLKSVSVSSKNTTFASYDGIVYSKNLTKLIQCPDGRTDPVSIPAGVTSIENSAFKDCTGITSVSIHSDVRSIKSSAFEDCTGITSITIPSGVTSVADSAFKNCTNLSSISISASTSVNGNFTFEGCGFTEPILSVDGSKLVSYLPNLTSTLGSEYSIPSSVSIVGYGAFKGCSSLTSVTIPNGVTTIEYHAFYGCTGLTSILIPESVTSVPNAFYGCTNLATAYVPSTLTPTFPANTTIVYYDPPVAITSNQVDVSVLVGTNFSYNVVTDPADATISVSGASWLNVNGHLIYGTVTEPGEYTIVVSAYKDGYAVGSQSFTVTVSSGLVFISGPSAGYIVQVGGQ